MDICIITADARLGRFIKLELEDAGYTAEAAPAANIEAHLYICDLDTFTGEIPEDAIGISYDENKRSRTDTFLVRPIDTLKLRDAAAKRLSALYSGDPHVTIEVERATRTARSAAGEVRLSEKELALLVMLCETPLLTREGGATIFGDGDSNVVDVYIHYLRKKLAKVHGGETIESKRGKGYSLTDALNIKLI